MLCCVVLYCVVLCCVVLCCVVLCCIVLFCSHIERKLQPSTSTTALCAHIWKLTDIPTIVDANNWKPHLILAPFSCIKERFVYCSSTSNSTKRREEC